MQMTGAREGFRLVHQITNFSGISVDEILAKPSSKIAFLLKYAPLFDYLALNENLSDITVWALSEEKQKEADFHNRSSLAFDLLMVVISRLQTGSMHALYSRILEILEKPFSVSNILQDRLLRIMTKILMNPESDVSWLEERHIFCLLENVHFTSIFDLVCIFYQSPHRNDIKTKTFFEKILEFIEKGDQRDITALLLSKIVLALPFSSPIWDEFEFSSTICPLLSRAEVCRFYLWCKTIVDSVVKILEKFNLLIDSFYQIKDEFKLSDQNITVKAILFSRLKPLTADLYFLLFEYPNNYLLCSSILETLDTLEDESFIQILLNDDFIQKLINNYNTHHWSPYLTNLVLGIHERGLACLTKELQSFVASQFREVIQISEEEYGY